MFLHVISGSVSAAGFQRPKSHFAPIPQEWLVTGILVAAILVRRCSPTPWSSEWMERCAKCVPSPMPPACPKPPLTTLSEGLRSVPRTPPHPFYTFAPASWSRTRHTTADRPASDQLLFCPSGRTSEWPLAKMSIIACLRESSTPRVTKPARDRVRW